MRDINLKTEADIKILREGGALLARLLNDLEKMVQPGRNTLDIDTEAVRLMKQYELKPVLLGYQPAFSDKPYPAATCISVNEQVVHGIPNQEPIVIFKDGDVVSLDVVVGYKGLMLDSARTVGVGNLDSTSRRLIRITKSALRVGIEVAKPGNKVRDIGVAIEKSVPKGFSIVYGLCGHGVGYDIHEEPEVPNVATLGVRRSPELSPGLVIAIEPMIIVGDDPTTTTNKSDGYTIVTNSGKKSAHMEHTVLITEQGAEILTTV